MPHPTMPALFPNAQADAQGLARRVWLSVSNYCARWRKSKNGTITKTL